MFASFFKIWSIPGLFLLIFGDFKQTKQFLQQINVTMSHLVFRGGIRTHNLSNMSLLPLKLDQDSRPS